MSSFPMLVQVIVEYELFWTQVALILRFLLFVELFKMSFEAFVVIEMFSTGITSHSFVWSEIMNP